MSLQSKRDEFMRLRNEERGILKLIDHHALRGDFIEVRDWQVRLQWNKRAQQEALEELRLAKLAPPPSRPVKLYR